MYDDNSYFTISKTADLIGVRSHVLRFWEKKFFHLILKKTLVVEGFIRLQT